jgi:dipeptidyl aminopeptidase/acylaminoacyl peptidase
MWYESKARNYFAWDGKEIRNITSKIKAPLWNEEHDSPSDPPPYGIIGWHEGDSAVYVYDRYNVWIVDPKDKENHWPIFLGFKTSVTKRYIKVDPEERFISHNQIVFFRAFDQNTKISGISSYKIGSIGSSSLINYSSQESITGLDEYVFSIFIKSKDSMAFVYSKENYASTPDLYFTAFDEKFYSKGVPGWHVGGIEAIKLSSLNPQQKDYNWGTSELFKWKTFKGKESEGILYKPEDFDPNKKHPVIIYFYEELSDGLNSYIPPAPTASRLNISFFVSRGYVVFAPDIKYTIGHPAQSAYDYIVSGAKALTKYKWIDAKNMGLQGQSWGGIQVAQLITMTDMFKAAWAGAPVANMTSAYGGIRWESGVNRQFQYEKTQSRIGATLWEKPQLYIENSPLFHLPKVKTPLVIMSNDADGAVPWYQGIEMFTAMRRLGKKVWMLSYNGEAHNLVERRNRKDIQIREQQYFDWLLKGEKPAKWITEGVPAVKKGKDWGLEIVE